MATICVQFVESKGNDLDIRTAAVRQRNAGTVVRLKDASYLRSADKLQSLNGILKNSWHLTLKYWFNVYKSGSVSRQTAYINIVYHLVLWLECFKYTFPQVWGSWLTWVTYSILSFPVNSLGLDRNLRIWKHIIVQLMVNRKKRNCCNYYSSPLSKRYL